MKNSDIINICACGCVLLLVAAKLFIKHPLFTKTPQFSIVEVSASETARDKIKKSVASAWNLKDYDGLESMYAGYIGTRSKGPAGTPDIAYFYSGFDEMFEAVAVGDEGAWTLIHDKLMAWNAKYPQSTAPILLQVLADIKEAWAARGHGFINTVSEKGLGVFEGKLAEAQNLLSRAQAAAQTDPEWYSLLFTVGMGRGWKPAQIDPYIDEAAQRHPDFMRNFYGAANYYYPQWFGSAEALDKVIVRISSRVPEQDQDSVYARLYAASLGDLWPDEPFKRSHADWTRMKKGFDALIAAYPDDMNLNAYARFACAAGDRDAAAAVMRRMGNHLNRASWPLYPTLAARCSDWAVGTKYLATITPDYAESDIPRLDQDKEWDAYQQLSGWAFMTGNYGKAEEWARKMTESRERMRQDVTLKIEQFYSGIEGAMAQLRIGNAEQNWAEMQEKTEEWLKLYPDSYAARLVRAQTNLTLAESFLGPGSTKLHMIPPQTEEDKLKMSAAIGMAHKYLDEIRPVAGEDSEWYVLMFEVAFYEGWPLKDFNALLKQALDINPYRVDVYHIALKYLPSLWARDGREVWKEVELLARDAQRRTQAKDGFSYYTLVYEVMFGGLGNGNGIFEMSYASWAEMKMGFDDMLKRYPGISTLNQYGRFACLAGDVQTAATVLRKIKEPDPSIWVPMSFYVQCAQKARFSRRL